MKLKKALEKAREERGEKQSRAIAIKRYDPGVEVDKSGRMSPIYSQSKFIKLNQNTLRENRCICYFNDIEEVQAYKVLRTQIQQHLIEKNWRSIMITSARPGEGKTITSINLSMTFAKEFSQTVLLVDCDFKYQSIHKRFGYPSKHGLIDYLLNDVPLKELIIWPGIDRLTVISGGQQIYETTELLGSPRMKTLVEEMKKRYTGRYVFFDAPPLLNTADAIAFAPFVDGILMVVEEGRTLLPEINQALALIPQEKFLGFIMNRQKQRVKRYY